MKHQDILKIIPQVPALVRAQNTQRQTDDGPQMQRMVLPFVMVPDIVNLGMAVVTRRNTVVGTRFHNLLELELAVSTARFRQSRLQKTAAAATAVIIRPVRLHVNKILFTHHSPDYKPQVFRHRIAETLAHQLARILNRKFDL